MIDPKIIRDNIEMIKELLQRRNMAGAVDIDELKAIDEERRTLILKADELREKRNSASKTIGQLKAKGQDPVDMMKEVQLIGDEIKSIEQRLNDLNERFRELHLSVPNILDKSVPTGKDDKDNVVVREWGKKPQFNFEPKPHYDIGTSMGILDFERGVKLAGARFYVYRGLAATLERAIINFMLDLHTKEHGYTETFGPFIVNDESMTGTGQYPKFKDEYYRIDRDGLSLIPTAEVTLTNLFRDEILEAEKLPIYLTMQSSCFRREAGAAGRDTRGLVRVHQFQKVELVKFVEPETSFDELEKLTANAEEVLKRLNLHYRVVLLCSGDTSASSSKTYDIEVWMPGLNRYMEISSCSNFLDYQARRAMIRYKKKGEKPQYLHTLNGSGLAAGRTLAAIIENYQREDGTFDIPEVLKKYM
ncbi:MAG TPA: serine--tRNA ligase [Spirochaetota bacterium]|mgnify:FL=1|jgi:seryl-tRNA synthetase|nr:MAG: Serine--tRNA ligase [Spirochaetes bacterium ADurb.Bin218]HON15301.1 serine--tRNA ligase [Spirochaetota bacterium]HOV07611.1 serine--tRNA ligase [Spirochaetota bacterium]HRS61722.1 serine--tRNA ligase [Spirochaetota bacterium]HRU64696.1 serine--tRNA ligase [Spirochaetota bacterium]